LIHQLGHEPALTSAQAKAETELSPDLSENLPQRYGKGPSHRKERNLSAEKRKGRLKQKEQKAHHIGQRHQQLKKLMAGFKQKIGEPEKERAHTHEPTLSRIRAPVDSETTIVVNGSKSMEREVSDAKGNSSTKANVVITRLSCLIDSPSIIQSRKQSQRPLKKDDFYFKILSWTVKKPKGKKEEQKQRRCLPHRPLTIYPQSRGKGAPKKGLGISSLTPLILYLRTMLDFSINFLISRLTDIYLIASNWLERLPVGSISTWEDLTTHFLAQFFPPGRTKKLWNDIRMFQQHQGESLSEVWTRFKDLL
ncbi:zinc finger, CCHC-type containing protein, partial [Tanacetum coccineum]